MSEPSGSQPTQYPPTSVTPELPFFGERRKITFCIDQMIRRTAELVGWDIIRYTRFKRLYGQEHEYVVFEAIYRTPDGLTHTRYLQIERRASSGSRLIQEGPWHSFCNRYNRSLESPNHGLPNRTPRNIPGGVFPSHIS